MSRYDPIIKQSMHSIHEVITRSPLLDAHGRLRISRHDTHVTDTQIDSHDRYFTTAEISGGGTSSAYDADRSSTTLSVSNTTAGKIVRQSNFYVEHQLGCGDVSFFSTLFGVPATGITRRVGRFDANDGMFLEQTSAGWFFVVRSSVSGSPVDTRIAQADWNFDKMDGVGESHLSLDYNNVQEFVVDYDWAGGSVAFGFRINRRVIFCHIADYSNQSASLFMSKPNLPLRFELDNDGTGAAADFEVFCCAAVVEGVRHLQSISRSAGNGSTAVTCAAVGTIYPLIGVRLKSDHQWVRFDLQDVKILTATANDEFRWLIYLNPTISGTFTYSDYSEATQIAQGNGTPVITGGTIIHQGVASTGAASGEAFEDAIRIGVRADGTQDAVVLACQPLVGTNQAIYYAIDWRE